LWSAAQPWCTDLREAAPSHASAALLKLKDVSLRRRKIGVIGMGEAPVSYLQSLRDALPRVTHVDFTSRLSQIRMAKSDEEITFLKRSAHILDTTYDALKGEAREGISERQLVATAVYTLSAMGSEVPIRIRWANGAKP